jgi:hypothetical protein
LTHLHISFSHPLFHIWRKPQKSQQYEA